jgi:peptide-methionine (S)-S-oxide reductase/peptide methionine sulfoxide reductase msrA/msrB
VKAHRTHHVEAVWVEYDAEVVTYDALCRLFFEIHDPAQTDGIGPDIGPQYRSQIFYFDEEQHQMAIKVIELLRSKEYEVNTVLRPVQRFWHGEEYHQDYYNKTGDMPYCHIRTKKF